MKPISVSDIYRNPKNEPPDVKWWLCVVMLPFSAIWISLVVAYGFFSKLKNDRVILVLLTEFILFWIAWFIFTGARMIYWGHWFALESYRKNGRVPIGSFIDAVDYDEYIMTTFLGSMALSLATCFVLRMVMALFQK